MPTLAWVVLLRGSGRSRTVAGPRLLTGHTGLSIAESLSETQKSVLREHGARSPWSVLQRPPLLLSPQAPLGQLLSGCYGAQGGKSVSVETFSKGQAPSPALGLTAPLRLPTKQ